jgi:hypothetical protein
VYLLQTQSRLSDGDWNIVIPQSENAYGPGPHYSNMNTAMDEYMKICDGYHHTSIATESLLFKGPQHQKGIAGFLWGYYLSTDFKLPEQFSVLNWYEILDLSYPPKTQVDAWITLFENVLPATIMEFQMWNATEDEDTIYATPGCDLFYRIVAVKDLNLADTSYTIQPPETVLLSSKTPLTFPTHTPTERKDFD